MSAHRQIRRQRINALFSRKSPQEILLHSESPFDDENLVYEIEMNLVEDKIDAEKYLAEHLISVNEE